MEMRCRHCRQLFRAPASLVGSEAQCPACGAVTVVDRAAPTAEPSRATTPRDNLDRVFEPIPKLVLYGFGVLLLLLILTPFWLSDFGERMKPSTVIISDDEMDLPPPLPAPVKEETPAPAPPPETRESVLDHYAGIRLDATREALQQRFELRLKNTRGMRPEIYEISGQPAWKKATLHFYSNELKEFVIIHAERNVTPLAIVRELKDAFGDPSDWGDERGDKRLLGSESAGGIRHPDEVEPRDDEPWMNYPYSQRLSWYERDKRLTATIYYTSKEPVDCQSVLAVHVSDDTWLINRRPRLTSDEQAESPLLMQPMDQTRPPEDPKRLFP